MKLTSKPVDEGRRLEALQRYGVLDTPPEKALDELTALSAQICEAPIALISFVDGHRQWFKSRVGFTPTETPREVAFCAHALDRSELLVVPDATKDDRFADNPLVTGEPAIRFYAGAPLLTPDGHVLGTLCVVDHEPRRLTDSQTEALRTLSRQVMAQLELRRQTRSHAARERLLQAIIDSEPECVKLVDADGSLRMMNPAGLQMIEADSFEQAAHHGLAPLVAPEYRAAFLTLAKEVFRGESGTLEFRIVGLKGTSRWLETHATPLRNESGEVSALLGITRDVTERRRTAEALAESEQRFSTAFHASPVSLAIAKLDGVFVEVNAAFCEATGLSREEALGKTVVELGLVEAAARGQLLDALGSSADGSLRTIEIDARSKGGGRRTLLSSISPITLNGVPHRLSTGVDITDRKEAETALRESEARLRLALDAAHMGTFEWNVPNNSIVWSLGHEVMWGFEPGEFGGTYESFAERVHPEDLPGINAEVARCIAARESFAREYRVVWPDGSVHWIQGRGEFTFGDDGEPLQMRGAALETTARRQTEEALRESQQRLELFIAHAPAALAMFDRGMRYLAVSRRWATDFGLEDSVIVGRSHYDIFPEISERWKEVHRRGLSGEVVRMDEDRFDRADGTTQWLRWEVRPWHAADGTVGGVVIFTEDISARRKAENEVRNRLRQQESVARLGSLALNTRDLDELLNTAVQSVSEVLDCELCKILELSPDGGSFLLRAGVGWREGAVGHAVVSAGHDSQTGYTLASSEPVVVGDLSLETRFCGPPLLDEHGVVSGASVVIQGRDGPFGVLGAHTRRSHQFTQDDALFLVSVANVLADFIRHEYAETQLGRERTFTETFLEGLPGIMYLLDTQGRLVRWNRAFERAVGHASAEIAGKDVLDLMVPEDRAPFEKAIQRVFEHGQSSTEGCVRARDGTTTPYLFSGLRLAEDGRTYLLGIGLDISDRRTLEEQLRQSQKMEAFGQLAGGVAHDFNNLLTVIAGFSDVLLSTLPAGDPLRGDVEAIADAGERAATLTKQLLAFSRQAVLEPKVLDLNDVVRETEKLLRRLIGEDIVLTTELGTAISHVKVDPGLLGQVMVNLAVNARDAMPKGGELTIETRGVDLERSYVGSHPDARAGTYTVLTITDTGTGMTPDVKARLFEPFFTTKGPGRGSGLGMAVVHGIIEQNGGWIEVQSEPGRGTTFVLYFPAVNEAVAVVATADTPEAGPLRGTATVVLVEDEASVRRLVRLVLEKNGYSVLEASSGEEALSLVETCGRTPELLITDVVMPGMDGRDVADALKAKLSSVKVLFLSGYTDDAVVRHGISHNEVAFLQKPFSPGALARKVRDVLATATD